MVLHASEKRFFPVSGVTVITRKPLETGQQCSNFEQSLDLIDKF